jgi:hypothetical protein
VKVFPTRSAHTHEATSRNSMMLARNGMFPAFSHFAYGALHWLDRMCSVVESTITIAATKHGCAVLRTVQGRGTYKNGSQHMKSRSE